MSGMQRISRRAFLAGSGLAIAGVGLGRFGPLDILGAARQPDIRRYLGASDGFAQFPGWTSRPGAPADGMYMFGFREVFEARDVTTSGAEATISADPAIFSTADLAVGMRVVVDGVADGTTIAAITSPSTFTLSAAPSAGPHRLSFELTDESIFQAKAAVAAKGRIQFPAPLLALPMGKGVAINLANTGFLWRPDLADSHTVHWHGFRNNIAVFDGVPEMAISASPGKSVPYFYMTRDPGTYMYHCHFEDVEHVQMGMQGSVFIEGPVSGGVHYAYAAADGSGRPGTHFDRQFSLMLDEIWSTGHNNDLRIQASVWNDYAPDYFTMNGRCYPDTVLPTNDPSLPNQPISSLIQANGGDRVLLRVASLGYLVHSLRLDGIALTLVAIDAAALTLQRPVASITVGPGDARDVIFQAPAFDANQPTDEDGRGAYNRYFLRNAEQEKLYNPGLPGMGGMATEVRVYKDPIPAQRFPGETV